MQCVDRLVARTGKLAAAAPGRVLDIAPLMGDLTMDVICSCVFGIEFNTQEGNDGAAMPQGMPYSGKELVWACRTTFEASKIDKGTRWAPLVMMLGESSYEFVRRLAVRFPDAAQRNSMRAREVRLAGAH
jgi:hypothetical protein